MQFITALIEFLTPTGFVITASFVYGVGAFALLRLAGMEMDE